MFANHLQRFFLIPLLSVVFLHCCLQTGLADSVKPLTKKLHHLRIDGAREWSTFPKKPESDSLVLKFDSEENSQVKTLQLRQQDVKEPWTVQLNGVQLGKLSTDGKDMILYFPVPEKTLRKGQNELKIKQVMTKRSKPDDIRVGEIFLHKKSREDVLSESTIEVHVKDSDTNQSTPCRLTITRMDGSMPSIGTASNAHLAIRPGVVYTSTGTAKVTLPAGKYMIYAGRGFEYSVDQKVIRLNKGKTSQIKMAIHREVPTEGFISCDTHVHTFTYSKHGDCTIQERMVTLAGEGIEFPIATDHNSHIDYESFAKESKVRQFFTPVIGNEFTTKLGHFNIFPVQKNAPLPNYRLKNWNDLFQEIRKTPNVRIIILNHARDIHSGNRPFGPKLYNEAVGENLKGWDLQANAMTVINSGATQTDRLQLIRDWMTQLNRGRFLTPVGCSDSHNVDYYIVGQGRTYIQCDDQDPGKINRDVAIQNFLDGHVNVSYGLITELKINHKYSSGDLAPASKNDEYLTVNLRVLGPSWVNASHIQLYANGQLIRQKKIPQNDSNPNKKGVQWEGEWTIKKPRHDIHLVAVATGPGINEPYWRTVNPYQPTSPEFHSQILGCSGAVWIDADNNHKKTSAYEYANQIYKKTNGNLNKMIETLREYDEAVAIQVAHLYHSSGNLITSDKSKIALKNASAATQKGFRLYLDASRKNVIAQTAK